MEATRLPLTERDAAPHDGRDRVERDRRELQRREVRVGHPGPERARLAPAVQRAHAAGVASPTRDVRTSRLAPPSVRSCAGYDERRQSGPCRSWRRWWMP